MGLLVDAAKVAIAHEWVSARAGSEKVFEALAQTYANADLYALSVNPDIELRIDGRDVHTSFLDRRSLRDRRHLTLPLMPLAWRRMGVSKDYDVVISSSHACVKGFGAGRRAMHLSYVHAPMRYAWNSEIDERGSARWLAPARSALRSWDRKSTDWVDEFACNSSAVAARVEEFYGVESTVIHPPVNVDFFSEGLESDSRDRCGLLAVGRLIPYKGFDLCIAIAGRLGVPLTVVGRGPEEARLRELAARSRADVRFETGLSDDGLRDRMRTSQLLLFPVNEDFGIIPVEAQAAGLPVIGPSVGGLLDTVTSGVSGVLTSSLDVDELAAATVAGLDYPWNAVEISKGVDHFSTDSFKTQVRAWVDAALASK